MANLKVKNADGSDKYLKRTGAGTDPDAHIDHTIIETNGAEVAGDNPFPTDLVGALTAVDQVTALPAAAASGGATPHHAISAATTNSTSVKGSAGQVYGVQLTNKNTSAAAYFKLYDKATAPTVGTDTPVKVITLPAAESASKPTVLVHQFPVGIAFALGVGYGISGGSANNDTTAVGSGDVIVGLDYK